MNGAYSVTLITLYAPFISCGVSRFTHPALQDISHGAHRRISTAKLFRNTNSIVLLIFY